MVDSILCFIISKLGLILNFVGSIIMAISFGKSIVGTEEEDDQGRIVPIASLIHPLLFKVGMVILSLGFLISIITK